MNSSFINDFKIIETFQLLISLGDVALVSFNFEGWEIKLNVTLAQDSTTQHSSIRMDSTSYAPEFEFPVLRFINWDNFLFSGMNKDHKELLIGTHDNGAGLYLRAFIFHSDNFYHLTLQFLAEKADHRKTIKGA